MRTVWLVLGLLLILGAMGISAIAQDTPPAPEVCAATVLDEPLGLPGLAISAKESLATAYGYMNDALTEGNISDYLDWLRNLKVLMSVLDAKCRGLSFTSEVDGKTTVIGPVNFPNGFWRAHFASSAGFTAVDLTPIDGDCDELATYDLFRLSKDLDGAMSETQQASFKTEDCLALINVEMSGTEGEWSLFFELVVAR